MATDPNPDRQQPLASDCRACPALVKDRECIARGYGPLDGDLVAVGEAPGAGDPAAGKGSWPRRQSPRV